MREPALVFARERDDRPELVVNFGVFSGREATEAEVYRLAHALLDEVDSTEIICEQRYEFDNGTEASVTSCACGFRRTRNRGWGTSARSSRAGRPTASPSGATSSRSP
jgi:hypothetical protein